jgi:hypothetical protein
MKTYEATGLVYGKLWGGGFGAYPMIKLRAKTKEALLTEARRELNTGGLDSGMGFEYLKGAYLDIEEIESIKARGDKTYTRSEYIDAFIGDLTDKERDFLLSAYLS